MPRGDDSGCGACGEALKDCKHPNGPALYYRQTITRWASGETCWPSWREKDEYRAYIAEMMARDE